MKFSALPSITQGQILAMHAERPIVHLLTDSRKPIIDEGALFFAITGKHHDGHDFVQSLYDSGVRQFVVEHEVSLDELPEANIIRVPSSVKALQQIAKAHREQFSIPVIGITGSNAKTIIKEWLFQLLSPDHRVIKNPGSYNSQIGVPLSVWQMQQHHTIGLFEAGISQPGEMEALQEIIQPTLGLFTNIGTAHDENFRSWSAKVHEKLDLFSSVERLIYCSDHQDIHEAVKRRGIRTLTWGSHYADILVSRIDGEFQVVWDNRSFRMKLPFIDAASQENALHCMVVMLALGYSPAVIQQRLQQLKAVPMRLELKEGMRNCVIIDDTYNNDLAGLRISLDFLQHQHQRNKRTLILSDIQESGMLDSVLAGRVAELVNSQPINHFIGIGPVLFSHQTLVKCASHFFSSTEEFLKHTVSTSFDNEVVLIKGARMFAFERIVKRLEKKAHGTMMEINLGALVHNLNYFRSLIRPETRIMAMVKAFAYGSGSVTIANVMQYHRVDYLGVAYTDEGVELRQNNITLPVMVMNVSPASFQLLLDHQLEPEIYSFEILESLLHFLQGRPIRIHIKLDTGMHRLGFEPEDMNRLIGILKENQQLQVASIFSHLAGADESEHDVFTVQQVEQFKEMADEINQVLNQHALLHLLNTPGILRFPQYQFDMVRLGIGLHGVDPARQQSLLKNVATLKTTVSQVKQIRQGDTIGYGRKGRAERAITIATIAIGYADGYSRAFSRGRGHVLIHGQRVPVIGNVCMDMTMVDCTGLSVKAGDEVIIFGEELPIDEVAATIDTIPYEILTNTSDRVKRIFIAESL